MSTIVKDSIAAQIATLTAEVDAPTEPFGYGTDLSCVTDLDPDLAEVDPASTTAIAQALLRRLITPRGSLPDDPDYGYDLRGLLNRGVTANDLRSITSQARNECRKDDRVTDVDIDATFTLGASQLDVSITVTPADPATDTFSFTFAITDTDAVLEVIS